jgi:hypothetical protein
MIGMSIHNVISVTYKRGSKWLNLVVVDKDGKEIELTIYGVNKITENK